MGEAKLGSMIREYVARKDAYKGSSDELGSKIREEVAAEQTQFFPPKPAPADLDPDIKVVTAEGLADTIRAGEGNKV